MAKKKAQEPLLYIHQPVFQKLEPPMQQSFLVKNRKNISEIGNSLIDKVPEEIELLEEKKDMSITIKQDQVVKSKPTDLILEEEAEGSGIMEFILEGILSPEEKEEIKKFTAEKNGYIMYLDSIQNNIPIEDVQLSENIEMVQQEQVNEIQENNTLEETADDRSNENPESDIQVLLELPKDHNISKELSPEVKKPSVNEQKKKQKKALRSKRTPFNQLSLEEKLNELKKMSGMSVKVLYYFSTKNSPALKGHYISYKNGNLLIQPVQSKQTINIPENIINDIKIIGI